MAVQEAAKTTGALVSWVLVGILSAVAPAECAEKIDGFCKGVALGGWWRDDYLAPTLGAQLGALRAGGATWVELTARWYQAERASTGIAPHADRSPSDASVRSAIRLARSRGLRVFLKPQIDLLGAGWRGEIRMDRAADWRDWFASYTRFITHYAALAREEGVDLFAVGVELDATRQREADWRAVIAAVRASFPGPLTFSANWGREVDIAFWDALDYAGVDEYELLEAPAGAADAEMHRLAERRRDVLRRFAAQIGKPVLFTEIGARSVSRAAVAPHDWESHGPVDLERQRQLVRTWIDVFGREPWLAGTFWWAWLSSPPADPRANDDFTTQGKPAWDEIRAFYGSR